MAKGSCFLFHNEDHFFYGELSVEEVAILEDVSEKMRAELSSKKKYFRTLGKATLSGVALVLVSLLSSGITAPNLVASRTKHMDTWDYSFPDIKIQFSSARKFLGLTQKEAAIITGLSKSTVEKIEQGVYEGLSDKSKKVLEDFVEWVNLLTDNHRGRKFIVRSLIKTPSEWLGEKSPLEYATKNSESGLRDLISLERKING